MQDFIAALAKRSSITCVTCERFGQVDIEFPDFDWALDFSEQVVRIVNKGAVWPGITPEDKHAWRQWYTLQELIKIFAEYLASDLQTVAMIAIESEESDHIEWRNRISWTFESGAKAVDLFQRLLWILE